MCKLGSVFHVQDKESMFTVMKAIDKAVGYAFYCEDGRDTLNAMMSSAAGADFDFSRFATIVLLLFCCCCFL